MPEIRAAIDLLGGLDRNACRPVLDALVDSTSPATDPDLAAFATARRLH